MGYTHYFERPMILEAVRFEALVKDVRIIVAEVSEHGIQLAGPDGTGEPIIDADMISLNGKADCGHPTDSRIVIPWPAEDAGGVAEPGDDGKAGEWFPGALSTRVCNGACDYETFYLPRIHQTETAESLHDGLVFESCKTAFRPYDLAVISILIAFKKHFGDQMRVTSDGTDDQWFDGKLLCAKLLDYGLNFSVNEKGELLREVA